MRSAVLQIRKFRFAPGAPMVGWIILAVVLLLAAPVSAVIAVVAAGRDRSEVRRLDERLRKLERAAAAAGVPPPTPQSAPAQAQAPVPIVAAPVEPPPRPAPSTSPPPSGPLSPPTPAQSPTPQAIGF